ncbi:CotH kinase family protein, partial [Candidatus Poribacteria bacterium]
SITLHYKPDSAASYQETEMYDDGKHGDGIAGDGIYEGVIPPNRAHQTVAFCIKAIDKKNRPGTWPRDLSAPGLYRIVNKPLESNLPTYRIIMTARDKQELSQRVSLSNEPLNVTFIFDERDVYYQATCRYTGSPHRRGRRQFSGYRIRFNVDEKLHGIKRQARFDRNNNSPGGYYNERISYDLLRKMGVPTCEQEWIHVRFNGRKSNLAWEDILPPSKRYLSIFYPDDSDGQLYEIFQRFTFYGRPQETGNFQSSGTSFNWLGTDDKDQYRWNYLPRNHKREDDFSNVIQLARAMGARSDGQYRAAVDQAINVDEWLKVIAVRVMVGDWDFLGTNAGKNSYIYRPDNTGRWDLLSWDNEWGFQQAHLSIWAGTQSIRRLQTQYQHLYLSYIQEIMDKYFNVAYLMPWFQHYHKVVNGVTSQQMASFVRNRRNYLNSVIPKAQVRITNSRRMGKDGSTIQLEGTAPVQTRTVRLAGDEMELNWKDATHWNLTISDAQKGNLTLEFLDYDRKLVGQARVTQ